MVWEKILTDLGGRESQFIYHSDIERLTPRHKWSQSNLVWTRTDLDYLDYLDYSDSD